MTNTAIVNAGVMYAEGLGIAKTAAKIISMSPGAARDSTNVNDIILSALASINGAIVGANGVDNAVLIASNFYAVYVIGDSTDYQPTAGLLSLNFTQPNLPGGFPQGGYDMYRRVGWILTDGSANILQFWQYGSNEQRMYYYDVGISALSAGASGTFANVDLATSVPPIVTEVLFNYTFTAGAATDVAEFLPYGSSATSGMVQISGAVATVAQIGMVTVPSELDSGAPTIKYKVTGTDTLTLLTVGFKDYIT
jgi:hypothetical protein